MEGGKPGWSLTNRASEFGRPEAGVREVILWLTLLAIGPMSHI